MNMRPVQLPNGVWVWNATPHPLLFVHEGMPVEVPTHEVINVLPYTTEAKREANYTLNTVEFLATKEGRATLDKFKKVAPDALVVGSIIASQAFPGEIVAPVPAVSDRFGKGRKINRCDRFTVFEDNKEI